MGGQEGAVESQGREGMGLLCCLLGKLGLHRPEERSQPKGAVSRHRSRRALRSSRTMCRKVAGSPTPILLGPRRGPRTDETKQEQKGWAGLRAKDRLLQ